MIWWVLGATVAVVLLAIFAISAAVYFLEVDF